MDRAQCRGTVERPAVLKWLRGPIQPPLWPGRQKPPMKVNTADATLVRKTDDDDSRSRQLIEELIPAACHGWGELNYSSYYVFESTSVVVLDDTGCYIGLGSNGNWKTKLGETLSFQILGREIAVSV